MENVKNLDGVRNLLFDLGGVIMNLRRENCVEALEQLGLKDADEMLGLYCQTGPFMQLEEGKITPVEFRAEIRRCIGCEVSDAEMDDAFNRFLLGIPVERLRALESLRKQYKIYMLSNTNAIMFDSKIKRKPTFRLTERTGRTTSTECVFPMRKAVRNPICRFSTTCSTSLA